MISTFEPLVRFESFLFELIALVFTLAADLALLAALALVDIVVPPRAIHLMTFLLASALADVALTAVALALALLTDANQFRSLTGTLRGKPLISLIIIVTVFHLTYRLGHSHRRTLLVLSRHLCLRFIEFHPDSRIL